MILPAIRLPGRVDPLALHRHDPSRYPLLLQSTGVEEKRARYDILLGFPQGGLRLDRDGVTRDLNGQLVPGSFDRALDDAWSAVAVDQSTDPELPFSGGWALFFSYEFAGVIEPSLRLPAAPEPLPLALALRCPAALIVDHIDEVSWLVAESGCSALLEQMRLDLDACGRAESFRPIPLNASAITESPAAEYVAAVEQALDYIAAGDVFQINLSRRWEAELPPDISASDVFFALRGSNPAPFAGLMAWDDWAIVSTSPERLVAVHGDRVETRPIAGTRPRVPGDDDTNRIRELLGHPKERAEHIMLIDLERNDLGRICMPGSIEVDELMAVESYAHVHHIVSNVSGRLRPGTTPAAVLRAVFPGGSITGCPKVRCMQLIAELEGQGRGAYTGAFGWLGRDGSMDLNILIRSLTVHGGRASFRAGAGIVADSDPRTELDETRAKARGLLRAFVSSD